MESKRKSTKKTPNLKDLSVQQRRLALLKQKQCDSIALNIVTKLIECQIEEDVFLKSLKYLNQSHYDDIVEERMLSQLCGYPICGNTIPDMPKKTFHISTKLNKVYDITERKNYCSNYCYKAGLYIKEQMLISPLWFRDQEEIPDFHLLPANVSGSPGREIDQGLIKADSIDTNQFTSATTLAHDILTDKKLNYECQNSNSTKPDTNSNKTKLDNNLIINTDTIKIENQFCYNMPSLANILKENAEYFENDTNGTQKSTDHTVMNTETIHTNLDKIESEKLPTDSDKPVKGILSKRKQAFGKNIQEKRVSFSSDTKVEVEIDTKYHSNGLTSNSNKTYKKHVNVNVIGSVHEKTEIYKNELTQHLLETNNQVLNESNIHNDKTNRLNRLKNSSTYRRANSLSKSVQKPIQLQQNLKQRFKKCLNEWITLDTIIFLYGIDFVKNRSEELYQKYMNRKRTLDLDDMKQIKYDSICKQLSLMELRDRKFDESVTGMKLRPLPSFDKLRDDGETMDLRVKAFYSGCYEDDVESETESIKDEDDSYEAKGAPAVLPFVESKDIGNIRKKIFLTSLSRTVPNICEIFKQCPNYLLSDIKNLINTFEFTAENIVFKTAEWSFITFMLIQLLSIRDKDLRNALDLEESKLYISSLQKQFMVETSHLDTYLSKTVDINRFI